ncbi:glycosyltransferase family 2 protein [Bacillus pseudomycoides]|uniref:Glycosyltransferase 2-like domain-containing protein n=1 Tax=Bacillus pseudomycoides TaxID=64104 RepID=A0A2B5L6R6_9BACI|nr:glycosyltransferase family 2 protein [Bacillus pseudomycoides]PDY48206.1 hypothetical protein CON79_05705 [Bacillus pseudomycoides]PED07744.1 hypothetical protein COO19_13245 [Bacillus pseudomycoides]PED71028.1 hypothetical protein CON97_16640 [Bacillus pseudomycoides]PEI44330.1 hypothetical protein CN620_04630 [Bacillus pseudomycoides]PEJ81286.1 hypothetical protein CN680_03700 [Bacillus pseudomycoides]
MYNVEKPLVSVIIPTFNREGIIERAINSVLKQTYSHFELIIVDDASADHTPEIISKYSDERLRYIRLEENTKGTKPRNVGIKESKGEFIAFLDSDDEWLPNKLEKQINYIGEFSDQDILCFTGLIRKNDKQTKLIVNKELLEAEDIIDYIFVRDNVVQTSTYMLSSELAKKILFNPELKKHQDWDFCLRLKVHGVKFLNLTDCLTVQNVELRSDRITLNNKLEHSMRWIEEQKKYLSEAAYHAFMTKNIANTLFWENRKLQAMQIYWKAYKKKGISSKYLLKGLIRFLIPNALLKSIINK